MDINNLTAEDLVEFWYSPSCSVIKEELERHPKIELETIGETVRSTTETPYFFTIRPYSGFQPFEDVESSK